MRKALLLALLLAGAPAAFAADGPGLPATADVIAALDAHPALAAAQARVRAAQGEADALARGSHEFTLSGSLVRRTVRDEGQFAEYEAQLTRPVRLPGKAALDRRIGAEGVTYAANMAEDARHQLALRLAQAWWDWLAAAQEARGDRQAEGDFAAVLASVTRRVALRDAARIEADQAQAALDGARVQAERSLGREAVARAHLAAQFPGLPLPVSAPAIPDPTLPAPGAIADGLQALHDRILGRSHEIAAAEALAAQAQAQADRARRDRLADPSLGVRVFSEKGGIERGGGVVFSMPLGGGYRRALADRASAQAGAAQADLAAVRRDIIETADTDLAEAEAAQAAWARARAALAAQQAALDKTRRGLQLGELGLAEVLLAERQMHDALRSEASARADAQRALTRLRIDAHELWIGDADDAVPAARARPVE